MDRKPTYEEIEKKVSKLEEELAIHQQTEKGLREAKERYRALTETANDWIWEGNFNRIFTYSNSKVKDLLGYDRAEVIGKTPFDFMPEDEGKRMVELLTEIIKSQKPFSTFEYIMLHKDGRKMVFETSGMPVFDETGNFWGFRGVTRDITLRKQAEEKLRESERNLARAQKIAKIGNWKWDIKKNRGVMSDQMLHMLGFGPSTDSVPLEDFLDHVHQDDVEKTKSIIESAIKKKKGFEIKYRTASKYGSERIMHGHGDVICDTSGTRVTHLFGADQDITEQVLVQNVLKEREKELKIKAINLEEANAALRVLLKQREEDKKRLEEIFLSNIKERIVPYLQKLEKSRLDDIQSNLVIIIKENLDDLLSPFLHHLSSRYSNLTPKEIEVASLVKEGKTTKEIAEILSSTQRAIEFHRHRLRKKLGINNIKANLRSHLLTL